MKGRSLRLFCAMLVISAVAAAPGAAQISIDFSSVPFGSNINGVTIDGVTFSYSNTAGTTATVRNGPGCNPDIPVCDPSVIARTTNSANLVMSFISPLSSFGFGLVVSTFNPAQAFLELFGISGASLGIQTLALQSSGSWSGIAFSHTGTAISRASLTFGNHIGEFSLDNITGTTVTPEPVSMALLMAGLVGVAGAARRRRRVRAEGISA
jgi:hypothetical protein